MKTIQNASEFGINWILCTSHLCYKKYPSCNGVNSVFKKDVEVKYVLDVF